MLAEIITIGDEILIGQIVDSNSAFMGQELNKVGIDVYQISSIQDEKQHILSALEEAKQRADIVLITGGLGPTKDDITKHTLCEYFDDILIPDSEVLVHVQNIYASYVKHTPMPETLKLQALVPRTATVLMNNFGTAPGMWFEKDNTVFVSMPGVPSEMKGLMLNEVLPRLQQKFERPYILHKTILTYGLGESTIAQRIEDIENGMPEYLKLAYLPNFGKVRLRLSARGVHKEILEQAIINTVAQIQERIEEAIIGYGDDEAIEISIGRVLKENAKTIAVAESCTGGKIAHLLAAHAGASAYFKGGVVAYATESKVNVLEVSPELIKAHTVTSHEVVEAMAIGVQKKFNSDYAIATTGNAGPDKGDGDAEVGTVFIAIATPETVISEKFIFSNQRERTIGKAVHKALELLLSEVLNLAKV